ncbi:hypothetical protein [Alkalilimnicola sp. S0819]|uniref:hypothetical protein n=1 Tax=Alkalilimnicola sp. S0819 TaxID=2613922 RepID=UPI001869CC58|nr:hypothetical protein [Alkalilimnicola sp. S0819]
MRVLIAMLAFAGLALVATAVQGPGLVRWPGEARQAVPGEAQTVAEREAIPTPLD